MEENQKKESIMSKEVEHKHFYRMALIVLAIFLVYAVYAHKQELDSKQTLQNQYNRSFYELVEYVDNVESLLAKAQISSTPEHGAKTLTQVWREANLAQSYLSQLPITNVRLENVSKLLNQVSDYSYAMATKTIENQSLSEEDLGNIKSLYQNCTSLNETLQELASDIDTGTLSWDELTKKGSMAFAQQVSTKENGFDHIEKNLQDYEGLIYDGAFSEHLTSPEPKGLGTEEYSEEMAQNKVYEYIDRSKVKELKYNGLVDGTIKTHSFDVTLQDNTIINIDITQIGGHVLWMNYNRNVYEQKLKIEEANQKALQFLDGHGYKNMKESYYMIEGGIVIINYAYTQNGVICYPDLIKVKVALDTGEIIGMETKGYLNSHTERQMEAPLITMEQAKEKLNKNLQINSQGLAIIPTEWQTEILTYEFKGKVEDRDFLVYINAKNGKEEKIYMIVETPNGVLAM